MHFSAYFNTERFYKKYCENNIEKKRILDVGSYSVNGSVKPIFSKGIYVGMDMSSGPNVDVVANCHDIPFKDNYFNIVISISCFEHDDMFWLSFLEICRVTKKGGYIYINAPSNGPYHGHPTDNWRFYKDSWSSLNKWAILNNYNLELIESYIDERRRPKPNLQPEVWEDSVAIYKKF